MQTVVLSDVSLLLGHLMFRYFSLFYLVFTPVSTCFLRILKASLCQVWWLILQPCFGKSPRGSCVFALVSLETSVGNRLSTNHVRGQQRGFFVLLILNYGHWPQVYRTLGGWRYLQRFISVRILFSKIRRACSTSICLLHLLLLACLTAKYIAILARGGLAESAILGHVITVCRLFEVFDGRQGFHSLIVHQHHLLCLLDRRVRIVVVRAARCSPGIAILISAVEQRRGHEWVVQHLRSKLH